MYWNRKSYIIFFRGVDVVVENLILTKILEMVLGNIRRVVLIALKNISSSLSNSPQKKMDWGTLISDTLMVALYFIFVHFF